MLDDQPAADGVEIPDASRASPELRRTFWAIVLILNVAIMALVVGALLVFFDAQPSAGGVAIVLGLVLLGSAYYRYRRAKDRLFTDEEA